MQEDLIKLGSKLLPSRLLDEISKWIKAKNFS